LSNSSAGGNPSNQYAELLDSLFKIPKVRYAAILDEFGDRLVGGMRPGVTSLSPPNIERKLETQSSLMLRMAEDYSKFAGEFSFISVDWQNMTAVFSFLPDKKSVSLSIDGMWPTETIQEVKRAIKSWGLSRKS
jgi:hypothetical protein